MCIGLIDGVVEPGDNQDAGAGGIEADVDDGSGSAAVEYECSVGGV